MCKNIKNNDIDLNLEQIFKSNRRQNMFSPENIKSKFIEYILNC